MYTHMKEFEGHFVFWGVVAFLAVYLLLTFYNPDYVQREDHRGEKNGENDQALTMLWAAGIVFLIVVVLALLWWAFSYAC